MKLPRDVSGAELVRKLKLFGYAPTRQAGSHIRVTTSEQGEHHITIPNHDPIRLGTLNGILSDVAEHFRMGRDEVVERLFG
jgi:predicted RNA binding protein YcfA (HicA-like mRNA interferase family)